MLRVPSVDPSRAKEIARLKKVLRTLQRTPKWLREGELADVREESVKIRLRDLGVDD